MLQWSNWNPGWKRTQAGNLLDGVESLYHRPLYGCKMMRKSSYFQNNVVQELFQIHGASAAIVSKKTLLHYGKYHNIHFSITIQFSYWMLLPAFILN